MEANIIHRTQKPNKNNYLLAVLCVRYVYKIVRITKNVGMSPHVSDKFYCRYYYFGWKQTVTVEIVIK